MNALEVDNLTKHFPGNAQPAIEHVSFTMENGEILALVGPSGCGKTTTLRLIAGLERPNSGTIRLNGRIVADKSTFVPAEKRGVGMVFQDHALFPHLTVFENVAFGLRGRSPTQVKETVVRHLELVGLESLASRYPHALSGGERQRVALARALAPHPVLILMDEPFSSLDADLRNEMREQVRRILKSMLATVVFVTHDQEEAMYMGDQLAIFQLGHILQIGGPEQIFHASSTRFVAEFMGDSDFLTGHTTVEGIQTQIGPIFQPVDLPAGTPVEIALRADDVDFQLARTGNGVIKERFFRGAFNLYRLQLDTGQVLHTFKSHTKLFDPGLRVQVFISAEHSLSVFHEGRAVSTEIKHL